MQDVNFIYVLLYQVSLYQNRLGIFLEDFKHFLDLSSSHFTLLPHILTSCCTVCIDPNLIARPHQALDGQNTAESVGYTKNKF